MGRLRILFAASEIYPLAKTGGLADVAASLPAALARLGADVHLLMPGYAEALDRAERLQTVARLPEVLGFKDVTILTGRSPDSGLPVSFVDIPELYRDGGGIYCHADGTDRDNNALRFGAFCHAAAAAALGDAGSAWGPDIVHCNDWHTGLLPLLLRAHGGRCRVPTVLTVHNMAFQGIYPWSQLDQIGLPHRPEALDAVEFYGQINFLKAGLQFADFLTTVSPTYAREIQSAEYGCGLEGVVASRARHLVGILNGIDTELWNPSRSQWLTTGYSERDIVGKRSCKKDLQRELGLREDASAPLAIFIGRLTWQKMADVLLKAVPRILQREPDRQFALLGVGDKELEQGFQRLAPAFPGRVSVQIGYSERQAQRFHAGGDILIHGSRYEPCGLTQLYAMRFGTIPVVRPVGGLADTVIDATDAAIADATATGFHFEDTSEDATEAAVDRAIGTYRQDLSWRRLQRAAMSRDFGWERSAEQYLGLYGKLMARRNQTVGDDGSKEPAREIA